MLTAPDQVETSVSDTTRDAFLGGALKLYQPSKGYRAGLDAVLLAAAVPNLSNQHRRPRLLDVGAGVGTVGLCAAVRLTGIDAVLVEKTLELHALSARNIAENGLGDRVFAVQANVVVRGVEPDAMLADNSFDCVVSNPPYYENARHRRSPNALKAASHDMAQADLDVWVRYMARKCRAAGVAMLVHRADQLGELLSVFSKRFGGITVLPLYPRGNEVASRVIVSGIKGSRAPLKLLPGTILHGDGNRFRPEIDHLLKTPAPLPLSL